MESLYPTIYPTTLLRAAVGGIVAALVLVLVTFLIADAASGPLLATQPGASSAEEIVVGQALGATIVGGLVGVGLALLVRRFDEPRRVFTSMCVAALVLYGVIALIAAETALTGYWLNVMHVAAAVPIVGMLAHWLPERGTAPAPALI